MDKRKFTSTLLARLKEIGSPEGSKIRRHGRELVSLVGDVYWIYAIQHWRSGGISDPLNDTYCIEIASIPKVAHEKHPSMSFYRPSYGTAIFRPRLVNGDGEEWWSVEDFNFRDFDQVILSQAFSYLNNLSTVEKHIAKLDPSNSRSREVLEILHEFTRGENDHVPRS